MCDIDYIIDSKEKENAVNYLLEFKEKENNILNTFISNSLLIHEKLDNKIYENFFYNKNIIKFLNFYDRLVCSNNYPLLTDIFFSLVQKLYLFILK